MSLWITYIHVLKPMKACFALKDIVWESHVTTHAEFLRSSFHCHDFHYFASTFIQIFNKFVSLVANGHRYNSKSNGDYMHDRIQSSQRWPRNRLNVQRGLRKVYDLDSIQIAEKQMQTWCFLLFPKGSWAIVGGWHMLHNIYLHQGYAVTFHDWKRSLHRQANGLWRHSKKWYIPWH